MTKILSILGLIFSFFSVSVHANISVNQTVVTFEPGGSSRQDIDVLNHSDKPVFLQIESFEIVNPGAPGQRRIKVENPRKSGLLVSPKRTALAGGARQLIRFVNLVPSNRMLRDKVFRVTVTPIADPRDNKAAAVKVIVAYEVLVILRPKEARADLVSTRKGEWFEFSNNGNSNVLLKRGKQCENRADNASCVELPGKRLYAGNTWRVKAPLKTPIVYEYAVGADNFEKSFQ